MSHSRLKVMVSALILVFSQAALSEDDAQYKYCFKVDFMDNPNIESATVKVYDHPWWRLFYPREVHSLTITDYTQKRCWHSGLPEMGLSMSYKLKEPQGIAYEFNCRKAPDSKTKYQAKTWSLYIRNKKHDESYPVDCTIK